MDEIKIGAFPKIFALGHRHTQDIFKDNVEITEKIGGSQFGFGKVLGQLIMRSKGNIIYKETVDKMFKPAVDYVISLYENNILPDNMFFYAEYLQKPKHNVLCYDRIPKNHLALFAVYYVDSRIFGNYNNIMHWSENLSIDCVRILHNGFIEDKDSLIDLLDCESDLGGQKIEGFVIKNYQREFMIGDTYYPITSAKVVSERFKERHTQNKPAYSGKDKFSLYAESFKAEARWDKAIIHLKEQGLIEDSPRDIGKLIQEVKKDIIEECQDEIKNWLWKNFSNDILRTSTKGLPEWYKKKLIDSVI